MGTPEAAVPFVQVQGLGKTYLMGERRVEVLRDLTLEIRAGELVALTGPSGAGKSTFLRLILGQERPSQGEVLLDGEPCPAEPGSASTPPPASRSTRPPPNGSASRPAKRRCWR